MAEFSRPPESFYVGLPPHVVDYLRALHDLVDETMLVIQQLEDQVHNLNGVVNQQAQRIAELEQQTGANSSNSSKPPSTEHPHAKTKTPQSKSKKSRGGQPGHPGAQRELIPTEKCTEVIVCKPGACSCCQKALDGIDPDPIRHQVWDIPPIEPKITEYQRYRLTCTCGHTTIGDLPNGAPEGQAGAQLVALVATLMGLFRQSKRRTALFLEMVLNIPASPSWIVILQNRAAEAMQPAYEELQQQLPHEPVLNIDESPTKEANRKSWIWTFVAGCFTFFACRPSRKSEVPQAILGAEFPGLINCDRAKMYWTFGHLQWCWAHLKRDFQKWSESECGITKRLGQDLKRETGKIFDLWPKVRDGTLSHEQFRVEMAPIRAKVEHLLLRGYFRGATYGLVRELYEHQEWLWSFVDREGIEPTNNAAEQALRHAVIWRKLSFGTQSEAGSRFVERILTVVETCRRQNRNVLEWLSQTVQAAFEKRPGPSLLNAKA